MKAPLGRAGRDSASDRIRINGALAPASAVPFGECADTARFVPNETASVNSGTLTHPEPRRGV